MRIALVAPLVTAIREPQLGGSQALLSDLATGLAERGHDVDVFASSGSSIEGVRVVDTGVDPASLRGSLFRPGQSAGASDSVVRDAFAATYKLVGAGDYDVVHNHAFDLAAVEMGAGLGAPVVHTLHLPPDARMAAALDDARGVAELVVAGVSASSARGWSALTTVDVVLRNGVPVDRIPFSPSPGAGLLFAGRFSPEKGALEAIDIAERSGLEITLVGNAYDEEYAGLVAERTSDRVHVRDQMVRNELWGLMASSAAVLCPVGWEEPFGLVAAEAQATGTPVVAFDRGALREVVADGETGSVVNDVEGAVRAVAEVERFDRGRCREHAERMLALAPALDAHETLYGRMAKARTLKR